MGEMLSEVRMGDPMNFTNFFNAVIDEASFDNIMSYISKAKESEDVDIVFGGMGDKSEGYFVEPTVLLTRDPHFITMEEEIFGPVITIFVYPDEKYEETLQICDNTSPYGLTGAIFANDRKAVLTAMNALRYAAGNFYINDKPTGAVVGQQPFGGSRQSGTNDKAGSYLNLLRWVSPRTIKENFVPPTDFRYPFMEAK
jgi:1-pyrroline-5-carboxylate dehydrogenase